MSVSKQLEVIGLWTLIYVAVDPESHAYAFHIQNSGVRHVGTDVTMDENQLYETAVLEALQHLHENELDGVMICTADIDCIDWYNDPPQKLREVIERRKLSVGIVWVEPNYNPASELL